MVKILSDVSLSTSTDDLTVGGTIELGHATDTTLSRSAAGTLAVEGVDVSLSTHSHGQYLADSGDTLTGTLTISNTGSLAVFGATSTANTQVTTRVDGEANTRWGVRADGFQAWGDGTASRDTNLYRSAANTLATDDNFDVGQSLTVGGDIIHPGQLDFSASGAVAASVNSSGLHLPAGKKIVFEGATDDGFETSLTVADPTADNTISLPDLTGTVALTSQLPPTGSIVMWPTATAPTDWLFLDGSTYNQSTYPALAAVFGVVSGTFTLPDMRDRFAAGASTVAAISNNAGTFAPNTANATAHDHTTNIAHAHANTIAVSTHGDHTHSVNPAATTSGTPSANTVTAGTGGVSASATNHTHSTDIAATTSGAESTNLTHTVTGGVTSLGATSVTSSSAGGTLTPKATLLNFIIKT